MDVQPAIDKVSKELREVSAQMTRLQPGERTLRDRIDEQRRQLRGDIRLELGSQIKSALIPCMMLWAATHPDLDLRCHFGLW